MATNGQTDASNKGVSENLQQWHPSPEEHQSHEDDLSSYTSLHHQWVLETYGQRALSIPFQQFWQDTRYPSYLRQLGNAFCPSELAKEDQSILHSTPTELQLQTREPTMTAIPTSNSESNIHAAQRVPSTGTELPWSKSKPNTINTCQGEKYVQMGDASASSSHTSITVIPKNRLSEKQKLVVVQYCLAAVSDFRSMGKSEFFLTQREIIKRIEGFDCKVESVMGDILARANVHLSECSEARSGVAVAASDLDQAAVHWAAIVKEKEEARAILGGKPDEGKRLQKEGELNKFRQMMTQSLAQKEELELSGLRDGIDLQGMIEVWESSNTSTENESNEEKGLPAAKRQQLFHDQDAKMLKVLAAQDDKMGRFYQETLTTGIEKLVSDVPEGFEQRLTAQEAGLKHLGERLEKRFEEVEIKRDMSEKKAEEKQDKIMSLLEHLINK
ncbi:hypothetical protein HOY82DRAFT_542721 [Tuber indicum]|nr:hypothetical protein HOY82DRAFT_542721 [Tuber indicum]